MKRNGKIELMRFAFCVIVFLYHIGADIGIRDHIYFGYFSFFAHGRSGVEFFLLVSGYFCARSAYSAKLRNEHKSIGIDTYDFMKKKILSILPCHIVCSAVTLVLYANYKDNFFSKIFDYIPSVLLLQRTGIAYSDIMPVEWYICSMLFALVIVYPLLRKSFDFVAYVVSPVVSSLMIGYMLNTYGFMPALDKFGSYFYLCNIRALAVILLGVFTFVLSQKINWTELSKIKRILLAAVENICWAFSVYFTFSNMESKYEGLFIYSTAIAVTICLSRKFETKLYQNKLAMYLGRLSLPVYLGQGIIRTIYKYESIDLSKWYAVAFLFAGALLTGIVVLLITDLYAKFKIKFSKKNQLNNA